MAKRFNHAFDFAFEVIANREDASDVSPKMLREALLSRVHMLTDDELQEACSLIDTYEMPDA